MDDPAPPPAEPAPADDSPVDLARRRVHHGQDSAVAAAVRAALDGPHGAERPQGDAVADIARRARRLHRRRVVAGVVAVAAGTAAATVVLVAALQLPGPPSGRTPLPALPAGPTATSVPSGARQPATTSPAPSSPVSPTPAATDGPAALGTANLLRLQDVAALGDAVTTRDVSASPSTDLVISACGTDAAVAGVAATGAVRADLVAGGAYAGTGVRPGLVEQIYAVATADEAARVLRDATAANAACSTAPGLEGAGATQVLDASAVTPAGGAAVLTVAPTSAGGAGWAVVVLQSAGDRVVRLDASVPVDLAATAQDAADAVAGIARTAATRAVDPAPSP